VDAAFGRVGEAPGTDTELLPIDDETHVTFEDVEVLIVDGVTVQRRADVGLSERFKDDQFSAGGMGIGKDADSIANDTEHLALTRLNREGTHDGSPKLDFVGE
jgi:NAD/NADP transhydrogenase alpha subunit